MSKNKYRILLLIGIIQKHLKNANMSKIKISGNGKVRCSKSRNSPFYGGEDCGKIKK